MKALMRSRMSLFTACTAAFAGGLALLISNGERISEAARLASANAAPTSAEPASGWNDLDFLLCHTPTKAASAMTRSMIRLAAAQTEAPQAKTNAASPALAFADTDPPIWDGLGSLSYKVTTSSPAAQVYFDQGLRLTYAFNHEEAQRAFRKAQKLDPDCAMCFWGEALVLGLNINLPMAEEAVAPAFAAMQKARTLAAKASPREQALITALSARYVEDPKADRGTAGYRLCRRDGQRRGAIPGGQRDRGAVRGSGHGSQSMELLAAGRTRTEPSKRADRADFGARACQGS